MCRIFQHLYTIACKDAPAALCRGGLSSAPEEAVHKFKSGGGSTLDRRIMRRMPDYQFVYQKHS
jgi:hypothetical protein